MFAEDSHQTSGCILPWVCAALFLGSACGDNAQSGDTQTTVQEDSSSAQSETINIVDTYTLTVDVWVDISTSDVGDNDSRMLLPDTSSQTSDISTVDVATDVMVFPDSHFVDSDDPDDVASMDVVDVSDGAMTTDGISNSDDDSASIFDESVTQVDTAPGPCQNECTLGKYTCADSTTIKGCTKGKGCTYVEYVSCPKGYSCQGAGECVCPPTDKVQCQGTALSYVTECGSLVPDGVAQYCDWPGCFADQCVPNANVTYLAPWPATNNLKSVWMIEDGFFATGTNASFVHELYGQYQNTSVADFEVSMYGVIAFSATQAIAVGNAMFMVWDGNTWSKLADLSPPPEIVATSPNGSPSFSWFEQTAVWGEGIDNFFSGGMRGTIYYFDGSTATSMPTPYLAKAGRDIRSMWGSSQSNVYAVGSGAVALRYDGVEWKKIHELTAMGGVFSSISGRNASDVYVVRNYEELWHYDGTEWGLYSPHPPKGFSFNYVAPADGNSLYLGAGQKYAYFDGTSWSVVPMDLVPYVRSLHAYGDSAVMVGDVGLVVKATGDTYTVVTQGGPNMWPIDQLVDIWGFPDGTLFACGDGASVIRYEPDGTITHWEMKNWVPLESPTPWDAWHYPVINPRHTWGRIWGSSPADVYIGSWGVVAHFDGKEWNLLDLPGMPKDMLITTIHGTGPNDVFLGGYQFPPPTKTWYMAHFDGTKWTEIPVTAHVGVVFGLDPDHWYAMIGQKLHQFINGTWQLVPGTISATANAGVLAVLPTGEMLTGHGGWFSCCNYFDMHFRNVSGKWITITNVAYTYGAFHLEPMPNGNFLVVNTDQTGIVVDVSELNKYMAENPDAWKVPATKVCKPYVQVPTPMYSAWIAPTGEIYMTGDNNAILRVEAPLLVP